MDSDALNHHLSRIETNWTAVFRAHQGQPVEAAAAQAALVERYGGAVHRYLLASLHDAEAAADLAQEFALRFLRGDFKNADPDKGRFRDFLKRSVYHLMIDYHRSRKSRPFSLSDADALPEMNEDSWDQELDGQFLESWRQHLMAHAWASLDRVEERTGQPLAAILRLRVASPELRSPQLAEPLRSSVERSAPPGCASICTRTCVPCLSSHCWARSMRRWRTRRPSAWRRN